MSNSKKLMLTALAVIFLIGATPLFADLDGIWEGYGEGSCETPAGTIIYPWQTWNGTVDEYGYFSGEWEDSDGNQGTFEGCMASLNPPVCPGVWTWRDDSSLEPIEMGLFQMVFYEVQGTCNGEWWPYSGAQGGTMWGWSIGD
ncbi:hypothetical protein CEE36_02910 [candidate division TA06 bacterium B3_TA06]|uniref:Uncharacterized protein n=1 Tax=candidate division TA06 bacterium B3_TA06 TaxID=2012487 RepID=A0A532V8W4_UNCT6|nr:MAG: hypothetical protein CEE36_02910 [candidate division TA06 bacterium B3_TA06]